MRPLGDPPLGIPGLLKKGWQFSELEVGPLYFLPKLTTKLLSVTTGSPHVLSVPGSSVVTAPLQSVSSGTAEVVFSVLRILRKENSLAMDLTLSAGLTPRRHVLGPLHACRKDK